MNETKPLVSSKKYCLVPMCTNTTFKTPNKIFFTVPKNEELRKKWCIAIKRDEKMNRKLSSISTIFCCEDHFDLKEDLENYWEYTLMNVRGRLKKNVIPHIFACQENKAIMPTERVAAKKRKHMQLIADAEKEWEVNGSKSFIGENSAEDIQIPGTSASLYEIGQKEDLLEKCLDKAVQVNIRSRFRSKGVNTTTLKTIDQSLSPIRVCTNMSVQTSPLNAQTEAPTLFKLPIQLPVRLSKSISFQKSDASSSTDGDDEFNSESATDTSESTEEKTIFENLENEELNENMRKCFLLSIQKNSKLFLGLPSDSYFLLKMLSIKVPTPMVNILVTLKKIRLDDPFTILGIHFGMSSTTVSRIFRTTVGIIASFIQELIVWPQSDRIQRHLPIPFRSRYGKVESIIDCLEIQIEKPTNPVHQALTWSQYKNANTIKYLISCTPDGLVNYISPGYGGRATDCVIVEDCGYLDKLKPGLAIMADRGFKNVSALLHRKNCVLIRPPSVSANLPSTPSEVKETKRIAALRIHVERVIGRLREFNMLQPHACIDNHHIQIIDYVIIIACGIINVQDHLFKQQT